MATATPAAEATGRTVAAPVACCAPLGAPRLTDDEVDATAALFKALADPNRVRLVHLLATAPGPVCVCDLTAPLGVGQPTVSHHLRKLLDAGLVRREARGTWAYYSLDPAALATLARIVDLTGGADRHTPTATTPEEVRSS
jgi:ArsR family transcriptional regulator, arsenate/arsenite/antimonite-responsive transcriptional repressor